MGNNTRRREWTAFDVIKGMLAKLDCDKICAATPAIHRAVHALAQKPEFKDLLAEYTFESRTFFPFSREIETDLSNLEMSGHLATPNPLLREYALTEKLERTFEKYTAQRFTETELAILDDMAGAFLRELDKARQAA